MNGIKQSNMNKNFIYSELVKENSYKYWKNHHDFKINEPDDIDWKSLKKAVKRLPVGSQRWNVKFTTGWLGTRHKLNQYGDFADPKCPNCDHPVEKSSHVLHCNHPKTVEFFNSKLPGIKKCLSESKTHPPLQNSIMKILKDWRKGIPITPASFETTFGIRAAVTDQDQIG